jgi:type IV pilus assembly protein PilB
LAGAELAPAGGDLMSVVTGPASTHSNGHARRGAGPVEPRDLRFGELLVAQGLISREQLDRALARQRRLATYAPLGEVLVAQGALRRPQLRRLLATHRRTSRLGEILLRAQAISAEQLQRALAEQRRSRRPLGEILVAHGALSEEQLRRALCLQLGIAFFDLDAIPVDRRLRDLVNPRFAQRHLVVPLAQVGRTLVVAMDDPTRTALVEDLRASTGLEIEVVTSTAASLRRALARLYGDRPEPPPSWCEPVPLAGEPHVRSLEDLEQLQGEHAVPAATLGSAGPVTSAVRALLERALEDGASDIHLESVERGLRVRFRVDGVLREPGLGPLGEALSLERGKVISRLKILSQLDIAERRRPQDGSFRARLIRNGETVAVDFRLSVIPGRHGENAVIRILDPQRLPDSLDALGLSPAVAARLAQVLQAPTGMVLVTGPTGSGKSTTLFAALRTLSRPGIKILTAEDPIEYVLEGACQHQVHERLGNTFARYLRAFLRHDPDVIMIGEIRDGETAELAFRAAQTGHLVLSTLHTNDALGAVARLRDLGVEPSLMASSLLAVLSQRLVREVCPSCRTPDTPCAGVLAEVFGDAGVTWNWVRGRGCPACHRTGYRGRIPVAELWTPGDREAVLIHRGASADALRQAAGERLWPMARDVAEHLRQGRTTLEELLRVVPPASLRELRAFLA